MTSHESPKQRKQGKTTRTMATRKWTWTQDFTGKNILMNTWGIFIRAITRSRIGLPYDTRNLCTYRYPPVYHPSQPSHFLNQYFVFL
jgi:hypothetical protein